MQIADTNRSSKIEKVDWVPCLETAIMTTFLWVDEELLNFSDVVLALEGLIANSANGWIS